MGRKFTYTMGKGWMKIISTYESTALLPAVLTLFLIISLLLTMSPIHAQETKRGEMIKFYKANCVRCHGADGSATGADGKSLKGEDFTDPKWQKETTDEKMIKVILEGKFFGLAMPPYKELLTSDDAGLIVTEIIRKSQKGKIIAP